jgi:hypothetical protein
VDSFVWLIRIKREAFTERLCLNRGIRAGSDLSYHFDISVFRI